MTWATLPEGLRIDWTESGPAGTRVEAPTRKGFGTRLLERTITGQLSGSWLSEWRVEGLAFTMRLPQSAAPPTQPD